MFVNVVGKESVSKMKLAEEGEEWEEIVDWFRGDVAASQADLEAKDSKGGSELSEDGADRLVLRFMEAEEVEFDDSGRREVRKQRGRIKCRWPGNLGHERHCRDLVSSWLRGGS